MPEFAEADSSAEGWRCLASHRRRDDTCVAVQVPDNAYATGGAFGDGWSCMRGFTRDNDGCRELPIPPNAFLAANGTSWKCLRGFRKKADTCDRIEVPENGFYSGLPFGTGWNCERGYRAEGQRLRADSIAHACAPRLHGQCVGVRSALPSQSGELRARRPTLGAR